MLSEFVELELETDASTDAANTFAYWTSLIREGLRLPRWQDFDWMEIPVQAIPCCGVVDVVGGDDEFVYRFWGTQHVGMHDQELTHRPVRDMTPSAVRDNVLNQYRLVRDSGRPRLFASVYKSRISNIAAREFSLRLPFSDDGQTITQIFALSDINEDFEFARKVCSESPE